MRQVPAGGLGERTEKVGQRGVAVLVAAEVAAHGVEEGLDADIRGELLEHRRALGIGDAVEVDLDRLQVRDVRRDRVGRGQLVLPVGPGLLAVGERGPGTRPPGRLGLAQHAGERGERLVQPEVVPPPHGHQVAEPHVRQLVQDRLGPALVRGVGDPGPENVVLQEGHASGVLHRTGVELGHEQLVVLTERVAELECPVVPVEALPGDQQDLLGVQVLGQRRPAVDAQVDAVVPVGDLVVRPGHQRGDVRRQRRGAAEVDGQRAAGAVLGADRGRVGHHLPALRRRHMQGEGGLEVRLVEAGVHPLGVGRLELRVQIHLAVDGVDEAVQPLAAVGVAAVGVDHEGVVRGQVGQPDAALGHIAGGVDRHAVEADLPQAGGDHVDVRLRARPPAAEPGGAAGPERVLTGLPAAVGEVELDIVRRDVEQIGARLRVLSGQVGDGHAVGSSSLRWDGWHDPPTDRVFHGSGSVVDRECPRCG